MPSDIKDYMCSITGLVMLDPVIDDIGETYEREAITNWFEQCKKDNKSLTSPNTGEKLEGNRLTPAKKLSNR